MTAGTRSWWGWGYEEQAIGDDELRRLAGRLAERFGTDVTTLDAPSLGTLDLRPPRVAPPDALADWCSTSTQDRAGHTYGKSYRDLVRGGAR